jgi:hypothetical protein
MKTRSLSTAMFAGAIALFATAQAHAAVTVTVEIVNPGIAYPTYVAGAGNPAATSTTGSVFENVTGSVSNVRLSPFDLAGPPASPGPTSATDKYTSVSGGGSATYLATQFTGGATSTGISFLWGSPDFFNTVTFFDAANVSLGSISNGTLTNPNKNPPQVPATGASWVVLTVTGGQWASVVFSSTTNAFEFSSLTAACGREGDTCTPPPGVPLPGALPLFVGGLGFVGFLVRRKKQKAVA